MKFRNPRLVWRFATAVLIGLLFVFPILYIVMISLESSGHFIASPLLPPTSPALGNFSAAWQQGDLGPQLINTVLYSVVGAGVSTALSVLIAYPVARKLLTWSSPLYRFFVLGICIPLPIIPLFVEARMLRLYDNALGYIILHVEPGLPLGVILVTAFILSIPKEMDEASFLDGCGYLRHLVSIIVPLAWPSIVITFLYSLLAVWNDIIGPVVLLASPGLFPVTRGVFTFYSNNQSAYPLLAAAVIIVSLPVVALFVASQRQLLRSTAGLSK